MDIVEFVHIGLKKLMVGESYIIDVHVVMVFIQQDLDYVNKEECGVKEQNEFYLQKA